MANVGPATRRVEALRWAPRIPGLAASPSSFELPSESFTEILIEGRVSGPFASTLTIELDVTVVAGGYHEVLGGPNDCGERNPRDCTYLNLLSSEDLVSMAFGDRALLLLEMPADAGRAVLVEVDGVPRTDGRLVQDGRGISFPTSALVPGGAEITVEYVARCDE